MPPGPPSKETGRHWAELDLLRGLAGILMVCNHAGVAWLSPGAAKVGVAGAIVFLGSLAPIIFFTVTGIGRGIQAAGRPPKPLWDPLRKAAVLFLADAALWLSPEQRFGLDFLGFIGLSALVLELLDRTRRPALVIGLAAAACFVLRYVAVPKLHLPPHGGITVEATRFLFGGVPGVSYPPGTWLVYPFGGWLVGRLAATHAEQVRGARLRWAARLAALAAGGFSLCLLMHGRHMSFFRWGSLSFAFCLFGFAAALAGLALVLLAAATLSGRAIESLSLPGVASFVLVPVHYMLVGLGRPLVAGTLASQPRFFPLLLLVVVPVVFVLSKAIDQAMRRLARSGSRLTEAWALLPAALALLILQANTGNEGARTAIRFVVQLLATGLFVLLSRQRGGLREAPPSRLPEPPPPAPAAG